MPFPRNASRLRAFLVLLAVLTLAFALAAPALAQSSPEERRLSDTRAKLDEVRNELESVRDRRETQAERLERAERQLATVAEAVEEAERAVERQQKAVEAARRALADLEEEADEQELLMQRRAVDLYKQGTGVPFEAILDSETPRDALERSALVDVVTRADRRAIEGLDAARTAADAQRVVLEQEEQALTRVLAQQQELHAEVEELREERALALATTDDRISELERQQEVLAEESERVAALARRASRTQAAERAERSNGSSSGGGSADRSSAGGDQARGSSSSAAAPSRGGWTWPARGPVTSEYGPRWGRMHQGLDIGAPTGAPIYAAAAGTVSYVGSMSGYGNIVLVDHGGGVVTAYAHMSAFATSTGTRVSAGQRIGSIGCTGSCTGPHLHFEVRVNGNARNPRQHLP